MVAVVVGVTLPADPFATDAPLAAVARVDRLFDVPVPSVAPGIAVAYMPGERVWTVWSGGQTGADQGALRGAQLARVETRGWAPKGWQTENGPAQWLATWGLREHSGGYAPRTASNVEYTKGTIIVGDRTSPGSLATIAACKKHSKPYLIIAWRPGCETTPRAETITAVKAWLLTHRITDLNVAGNRESRAAGIGAATEALIRAVLTNP